MTRILAIMAHPDDAEFTCGGTFAKWIREGKEVHYIVCTIEANSPVSPNGGSGYGIGPRPREKKKASSSLRLSSGSFCRKPLLWSSLSHVALKGHNSCFPTRTRRCK